LNVDFTASLPDALSLAASLAVGLLIGLERGWRQRELSEGGRVAGLRTFALTGLLGGLLASLPDAFGGWPLFSGFLGLSLLLAVAYREEVRLSRDLSITTAVAMLMTLVLGALAASGAIALALAAAVIVAVLLDLKPTLHGWLRLIEHRELTAALQLLVLSVVILPNLPNAGFGPYGALNPYALWWAVVLIAGLSLAGHLAMRLTGSERGILWTGILGGLASSTAATVTLARRARAQPALAGISVAGILAACGVMFFRMAVLIGMIQPALLNTYGLALSLTGLVLLLLSVWTWRRHARSAPDGPIAPIKPFDLGTALGFGVFLAVMAVLVPAAKQWFGASGIYLLSAVSGLADVDAIVISLARMHASDGMSTATAVVALGLATLSNMVVKASIAWTTGGTAVGWQVCKGYALAMLVGTFVVIVSIAA
jgi:uncharacterized membrane protein (DUF4010 family)